MDWDYLATRGFIQERSRPVPAFRLTNVSAQRSDKAILISVAFDNLKLEMGYSGILSRPT